MTWTAETVNQTLDSYMVRRPATANGFSISPDEVEPTARRVADVMLSRRFRRGLKPSAEAQAAIAGKLRFYVRRSQPVRLAIGYAPLKNLNATERNQAEWAEAFSFHQLARLDAAVQEVYPPGLRIRVACDDALLHWVNGVPARLTREYMASLKELIARLDLDYLVERIFPVSRFMPLTHLTFSFTRARWRMQRWESDPANRSAIETMDFHAFKNLMPTPNLSELERWALARRASRRYRIFWEALELSGLPRLQRPVMALYSNERGLLRLFSLCTGNVSQPWQGEGCLRVNENGELVPFVLTQERKDAFRVHWVNGLNVAGGLFDRIRVVEPVTTGTGHQIDSTTEVESNQQEIAPALALAYPPRKE